MRKQIFVVLVIFLLSAMLIGSFAVRDLSNYQATLSYYGSRGQEVIDIQSKLYNWGYYNGIVDGIYGYETYKAVRLFQYKNGLSVDGVAGAETLSALGLPTGAAPGGAAASAGVSNSNADLLAHLIHGEARGEPYIGKVAVAAVVLNRTGDSRFPKTIAGVIYQPGAFDAVSDGQINLEPDNESVKAARDALNGWDPSYGAVYYFNPATATNRWIWSRPYITTIGKHRFCK